MRCSIINFNIFSFEIIRKTITCSKLQAFGRNSDFITGSIKKVSAGNIDYFKFFNITVTVSYNIFCFIRYIILVVFTDYSCSAIVKSYLNIIRTGFLCFYFFTECQNHRNTGTGIIKSVWQRCSNPGKQRNTVVYHKGSGRNIRNISRIIFKLCFYNPFFFSISRNSRIIGHRFPILFCYTVYGSKHIHYRSHFSVNRLCRYFNILYITGLFPFIYISAGSFFF